MEASTILPVPVLSLFSPKQHKRRNGAFHSLQPLKQRTYHPSRINCNKMFVPGGLFLCCLRVGFGNASAADLLLHCSSRFGYGSRVSFLDMGDIDSIGGRSVRVGAQFISTVHIQKRFGEASPEAKAAKNLHNFFTFVAVKIVTAQLEDYNREAHEELMEFLSRNSLDDGDKFCADLMRESSRHKSLAMRILEVRSAYCKKDFEWDNMKKLSSKMVDDANTRLMREYVLETSHVEIDE